KNYMSYAPVFVVLFDYIQEQAVSILENGVIRCSQDGWNGMGGVVNNTERIDDVGTQCMEKITDVMDAFGAPNRVGLVLGIISMNREPMTLDELSAETGMSKTRMSQVVREMIDMNITERVFKKGFRKDLYQVEEDYYQTFISLFTSTWQKAINRSRHF